MPLAVRLLHQIGKLQRLPHRRAFERVLAEPERAQRERLAAILALSRRTAFGREHHLDEVHTLRDLQRRVPLQSSETLRPYIAREMAGERHVLCGERPVLYAISSGTTGKPKRVPMTAAFRKEFQTALLTSMAYVQEAVPEAFTGTLLYFVARRQVETAPDGTPVGYTSGFNFASMPRAVRKIYAVPYELFEVGDEPTRAYLTAWLCAMSRVTVIGAIFPLALIDILRLVENDGDALARDLERGTLRGDLALSSAERAFFERHARPMRARADRLRSDLRASRGVLDGRALFPDVKLVYAWTSASAAQYVPDLKARLPPNVKVLDALYAANEGWSNVPLGRVGVLGGPMSVRGHVYELIDVDDYERGVREGVPPEGVKPGRQYRLVLTTSAGLVRYDLDDVVECTGFEGRTPCIHFARRGSAAGNLVGEKLEEWHVQRAVVAALGRHGITPGFFTALPRYVPEPRWEILLELPDLSDDALRALRAEVDDALGVANDEYLNERRGPLRPVALRVLAPGTFDAYRRGLAAKGAPIAQMKVLHLQADPDAYAELPVRRVVEASP